MQNPIDNVVRMIDEYENGTLDFASLTKIDKDDLARIPVETRTDISYNMVAYGGLTIREIKKANQLYKIVTAAATHY